MTKEEFAAALLLMGNNAKHRLLQRGVCSYALKVDINIQSPGCSVTGTVTFRPRGFNEFDGFLYVGTKSTKVLFVGKKKQVLQQIVRLIEESGHQ